MDLTHINFNKGLLKMEELAKLRAELDGQYVMQLALKALVSSLIRTHHDETNLQLSVVEMLELLLNGPTGQGISVAQQEKVRDAVETIRLLQQRTPSVPIEKGRF